MVMNHTLSVCLILQSVGTLHSTSLPSVKYVLCAVRCYVYQCEYCASQCVVSPNVLCVARCSVLQPVM
ncbi:hypothetical protein M758_6G154600 [Ceratodon purpureus]|uniref:Secreted protein n=1 Tax=Ceratodon purpureus TaxID=3225 RepID=A0A8T0HIZ2_CERPU|nr:hypothetical protein KC19_6G160600 [Ceratodon purpureus]KAG0614148.1 hypothetical protein M758_6G154600 [Ceratodon purpureus]